MSVFWAKRFQPMLLLLTSLQEISSVQGPVEFHEKLIFKLKFKTLVKATSWRTSHFRLPVTAYSIFSQLPSITGLSSPAKDAASCKDRDSICVAYEQDQLK